MPGVSRGDEGPARQGGQAAEESGAAVGAAGGGAAQPHKPKNPYENDPGIAKTVEEAKRLRKAREAKERKAREAKEKQEMANMAGQIPKEKTNAQLGNQYVV